MTDSLGNAAQTRIIAEQVADAVLVRYASQHPDLQEAKIPSPLKWAGMMAAAAITAGGAALAIWLVSSVGEMQVTLARMDERMVSGSLKDHRFDELDRRVVKLENPGGAR